MGLCYRAVLRGRPSPGKLAEFGPRPVDWCKQPAGLGAVYGGRHAADGTREQPVTGVPQPLDRRSGGRGSYRFAGAAPILRCPSEAVLAEV
jgi:hypothetical protein